MAQLTSGDRALVCADLNRSGPGNFTLTIPTNDQTTGLLRLT